MHRWPTRLAVLATALLASIGVGVVALAPAAYADNPGCGDICDNRDPSFTYWDLSEIPHVCSDSARTVRTRASVSGVTIELRYSTWCRTTWARTTAVGFGIKVESYYSDGRHRTTTVTTTTLGVRYSLMLNDAGLANRACVRVPFTDTWDCTDTY